MNIGEWAWIEKAHKDNKQLKKTVEYLVEELKRLHDYLGPEEYAKAIDGLKKDV